MPGWLIGPIGVLPVPAGGFQGTGDVVSGADHFWGLRAYNAAYAVGGANPCIDIADASNLHTTTIPIATNGGLDIAAVNSWIASWGSTVTIRKVYDQIGTNHWDISGTVTVPPRLTLTAGGSGTKPGILFNSVTDPGMRLGAHIFNGLTAFSIFTVAKRIARDATFAFTYNVIIGTGNYLPFIGWGSSSDDSFIAGITGGGGTNATGTALDNITHSLSVICDNSNQQTGYIDGVSTGTVTFVGAGEDADPYVGYNAGFSFGADMVIHEVRVDLATRSSANAIAIASNHTSYWGGSPTITQSTGLKIYYTLDETSNTTAFDTNPNGLGPINATWTGPPGAVASKIARGRRMTNAPNTRGQTSSFQAPQTALSMSLWVKPLAINGTFVLGMQGASDFSDMAWVFFQQSDGTLDARVHTDGSNYIRRTTTATVTADVWAHLVMTWSGSTIKIYLNGTQVDNSSANSGSFTTISSNSFALAFGDAVSGNGSFAYDGIFDDWRLYSRELSGADVTEIYNAGLTGNP